MPSERELRETETPWPKTLEELNSYVKSLAEEEDYDYGSVVYAVSLAATATFHYMACRHGITGFQASIADLDILRRTRSYKGPFMIIDGSKLLYPQFDVEDDLRECLPKWQSWASEEAKKMLADPDISACESVRRRWEWLASLPISDDEEGKGDSRTALPVEE